MSFSLHAYYCAEHVAALRLRISEMREPPLGLQSVPDDYLEILFDEIIAAPTTGELLLGVYETALPALRDARRFPPCGMPCNATWPRPTRWPTTQACG